jgi:hypothetical protein
MKGSLYLEPEIEVIPFPDLRYQHSFFAKEKIKLPLLLVDEECSSQPALCASIRGVHSAKISRD